MRHSFKHPEHRQYVQLFACRSALILAEQQPQAAISLIREEDLRGHPESLAAASIYPCLYESLRLPTHTAWNLVGNQCGAERWPTCYSCRLCYTDCSRRLSWTRRAMTREILGTYSAPAFLHALWILGSESNSSSFFLSV